LDVIPNIVYVVLQVIHLLLALLKEMMEEQGKLFKVVVVAVELELLVVMQALLKMEQMVVLD
jgi:hypothetical protein